MDEGIYKLIMGELEKRKIDEEPEDLLLDMAERIADTGIMEKEVILKENYAKTEIQVCGKLLPDEDGEDEPSVFVKWIKVGKAEFKIEDYIL